MFDSDVIKQGIEDESILEVMREVDRRRFVPEKYSDCLLYTSQSPRES